MTAEPDVNMDTLLIGLPTGEAQYVRNPETGAWDVCLFAGGSTMRIMTVATNMDKSVACWVMHKLNAALETLQRKET